MIDSVWVAIGSAAWLGILTSISPCPLATNIAAITYIGKRVDRPGYVLAAGLLYTMGRTVAYIVMGMLIVASVLVISDLSFFLQRNMNMILGPVLLIVGLFLIGAFKLRMSGLSFGGGLQERVEKYGLAGAGLLGLLFALSLCPVSAALFFGSLVPLAIEQNSAILMPTVYGIGTALPVVLFALLIAMGAKFVGTIFARLQTFEIWARRVTGAVFVGVGLYYVLVYIIGWQL